MLTKTKIDQIRSLRDKNGRQELRLFVAEGEKLVSDLLNSSLKVVEVMTTSDRYFDISGVSLWRITTNEMKRISNMKTPSTMLALVEIPSYNIDFDAVNHSLNLALDEVQDPGNLGTIIRIADWFGITNIFCSPDTVDCFNPKVVQATMGSLSRVRVHYVELTEMLKKVKIPIYGTSLEGDNLYSQTTSDPAIIVMGNEGSGISKEVDMLLTNRLLIPSFPPDRPVAESLNVATATAIVCAEFRAKQFLRIK